MAVWVMPMTAKGLTGKGVTTGLLVGKYEGAAVLEFLAALPSSLRLDLSALTKQANAATREWLRNFMVDLDFQFMRVPMKRRSTDRAFWSFCKDSC